MHPVLLLVHIIPLFQYMLGSALQFLVLTAETLFIYLFLLKSNIPTHLEILLDHMA